jgi:3-hydroxybutyrate dehydrogenase
MPAAIGGVGGQVLALETADTDITINTVCPAYLRTPLVDA